MNFVKPLSLVDATGEPLRLPVQRRKWPFAYRSVGIIALLFDVVVIMCVGVFAGVLYNMEVFGTADELLNYFGSAAAVAALFVAVMKSHGLYTPSELLALRNQIGGVATTWASVFLFLAGIAFALKIGDQFSRGATLSFAVIGLALLIGQRVLWRAVLLRGLEGQRFSGRKAILITDEIPTPENALVRTLLKHGIQLSQLFVIPVGQQHSGEHDMVANEVVSYLRRSDIQEVIVSVDEKHWADLRALFGKLRTLPLQVSLFPVGAASEILSRPSHAIGNTVCIELQREPLDTFERGLKRVIDLLGSIVGLIVLLPLLIITAIMIKLDFAGTCIVSPEAFRF